MAASEGQCTVMRGCAKTTSHYAADSRACRLRGEGHSILQTREPEPCGALAPECELIFAPHFIEAAAMGMAYTIVNSYKRRLKETKR